MSLARFAQPLYWRERVESEKGHGRRHTNYNLSIIDYLVPPVGKREHVAKQEGVPSLFSNVNAVFVHALSFKRKKICSTVPSAAAFCQSQ